MVANQDSVAIHRLLEPHVGRLEGRVARRLPNPRRDLAGAAVGRIGRDSPDGEQLATVDGHRREVGAGAQDLLGSHRGLPHRHVLGMDRSGEQRDGGTNQRACGHAKNAVHGSSRFRGNAGPVQWAAIG